MQKAKTRMGRTIGQIGTRETSVTARADELAIGIGPCPQITISASGSRTCRQGRPDRGPRSITTPRRPRPLHNGRQPQKKLLELAFINPRGYDVAYCGVLFYLEIEKGKVRRPGSSKEA